MLPHRAKIILTVQALNTTKYLINETEYMPWESAVNNLDFFYLMFDRSEVYGPMQVQSQTKISLIIPTFMELSHLLYSVFFVFRII